MLTSSQRNLEFLDNFKGEFKFLMISTITTQILGYYVLFKSVCILQTENQ